MSTSMGKIKNNDNTKLLIRMWNKEFSFIIYGSVKWNKHFARSPTLNLHLYYNPAISLLGIHIRNMNIKAYIQNKLYKYIRGNFIQSSQNIESTQCPSKGEWLSKL